MLRLTLAFAALALVACDRRAPAEAPANSQPTAVAEAPATPDDRVSAPTAPPPPQATPATRPDALIAAIPAGDALVALDISALSAWAAAGVDTANASDRSTALVAEAIASSLERHAPGSTITLDPETRAAAWSWTESGVSVALDRAPTSTHGGTRSTTDGVHVVGFGTPFGGPAANPELSPSALLTASVSSLSAIPEPLFGSLDFLAPLDVSSLSFAVESSGAMQLRATTPNPTRVTEALGRGQIFVSQALGQLNAKASPELQGWVTYANRLTQAVFGRVSVTATEDSIDLSLPPPACGGPVRNAIVAAAVITFADAAAADPATPASPWVPMSAPTEERCGPMEGPSPTLPAAVARFGTPRSDVRGALLVLDLSASLRAGLPTFFGALPFALPDSTIHQAFGNRPMGLTSLADPSATVIFSRDHSAGASAPARQALLLPASMAPLVDGTEPIDTMAPFSTPAIAGYATPDFDVATRDSALPSPPWSTALSSLPADTLFAAVLNAPFTAALAGRLPSSNLVRDTVHAAEAIVIAASHTSVSIGLIGVPRDISPVALREAFPSALASITSGVGTPSNSSEELVALALDHASIRVSETTAWLEFSSGGLSTLAAAIRIGLPLFAGASGRGPIDVRFPSGALPSLQQGIQAP